MVETFIALAFAHILADYVFQPTWMVRRKREPAVLLLHAALVLALAMAATGRVDAPEILALGAAHLLIDTAKIYLAPDTLASHLGDQAAHLASLCAVAYCAPHLWATGIWASAPTALPHAMLLLGGLLFATRAGAFAITYLMARHTPEANSDAGLPQGGRTIGHLERGLIYMLMLADLPGSIGFLIAAKSILRFSAVNQDRRASEYVIIGTLASFGWAILAALSVLWLQSLLPDLEQVLEIRTNHP
ncbi:MAG: DUF3307 domain-containing protein [Marinosulfonomonas sp.]|nr:DUF3307 domain-containing protein [Marinosulfonomonas sp.]